MTKIKIIIDTTCDTEACQIEETPKPSDNTETDKDADQQLAIACALLAHYGERWLKNAHLKAGWEYPYYEAAKDIITTRLGQLPDLAQAKRFFAQEPTRPI